MNVLDEFKNYKRKFIQISHRTAILMHIFEKADDDFEDMILSDHKEYCKQNHGIDIYKEAAGDEILRTYDIRDKINGWYNLCTVENKLMHVKTNNIKEVNQQLEDCYH